MQERENNDQGTNYFQKNFPFSCTGREFDILLQRQNGKTTFL